MATQKSSGKDKPGKKRKVKAAPGCSIMVGCCSAALDLILHDPACKVELTGNSIRITHPTEKFSIVGLPMSSVKKDSKPWQIPLTKGEQ